MHYLATIHKNRLMFIFCTQGRIYSKQGPVQKKMWGTSPGTADPIFPGKKLATFFSHHCPCVSCQFS